MPPWPPCVWPLSASLTPPQSAASSTDLPRLGLYTQPTVNLAFLLCIIPTYSLVALSCGTHMRLSAQFVTVDAVGLLACLLC